MAPEPAVPPAVTVGGPPAPARGSDPGCCGSGMVRRCGGLGPGYRPAVSAVGPFRSACPCRSHERVEIRASETD